MENKALIGDNTYVLTLQNGAGHEDIIEEFASLALTGCSTNSADGQEVKIIRV